MGSKKNILIIEDRKEDIELIQRAISKEYENVAMKAQTDSEAVLKQIETGELVKERLDLILIDINMPRVSGLEILKALQHRPEFERIPKIILSSSDHPKDLDNAYSNKVNSYVIKPNNYSNLKHVLKSIVDYWLEINHN